MPVAEIKKVCCVGAGTMGCYNSLITALAGFYDYPDPEYQKPDFLG